MEFTSEELKAVEIAVNEKRTSEICEPETFAPMMSGGGFGDVAF